MYIGRHSTKNTTGATNGAGTAYPSRTPLIFSGLMLLDLQFYVYVLQIVFWPLCCLSYDLRILITPLVSSNSRPLCCLSFDLRILITPLVSSNSLLEIHSRTKRCQRGCFCMQCIYYLTQFDVFSFIFLEFQRFCRATVFKI